jgi:hypothetical protein
MNEHARVRRAIFLNRYVYLNSWMRKAIFFEMHLRIQLPRGSWYVGLRGARRDYYPLKPQGKEI